MTPGDVRDGLRLQRTPRLASPVWSAGHQLGLVGEDHRPAQGAAATNWDMLQEVDGGKALAVTEPSLTGGEALGEVPSTRVSSTPHTGKHLLGAADWPPRPWSRWPQS